MSVCVPICPVDSSPRKRDSRSLITGTACSSPVSPGEETLAELVKLNLHNYVASVRTQFAVNKLRENIV